MIVFGDHDRDVTPRRLLGPEGPVPKRPIERHARLVAALVGAGQAAQALLDEDFIACGENRAATGMALWAQRITLRLATLVRRSWESGLSDTPDLPGDLLANWPARVADRPLTVREPEGFTHYAVYPEGYGAAAMAWPERAGARTIGIRSIGTTLAAMVAAATGETAPPVTLRPTGHPFARRLALDPALERRLAAAPGAIAIVDEGPGLSGSSFGAVADLLEAAGIAPQRLAFFPSHAGDLGPEADPRHRARWAGARRRLATFDDIALVRPAHPAHRLEAWVADLTGPLLAPIEDISGGGWRSAGGARRPDDPPVDAPGERRKFLARGRQGTVLLRFSGLGPGAVERFALHRRLAEARATLQPLACRHGFTVEPWRPDLVPLAVAGLRRDSIVDHLGVYLGLRARLAAEGRSGASPEALLTMAQVNIRESLGEAAASRLDGWAPHLSRLGNAACPVLTDNRLQRWEWLADASGRIVKTDAVDHHVGHDLIGCQDIAWDLAGAALEFDLDDDEIGAITRRIGLAGGREPDRDLLAFCRLAYPAFQIGLCARAESRAALSERGRWSLERQRYEARLRASLA